jgi:hypothetical protein
MSLETYSTRWRAAVTKAANSTLADRWQATTRQWLGARAAYRTIYDAQTIDVSALRKAAQRLHDLEQLRNVLARELQQQNEPSVAHP